MGLDFTKQACPEVLTGIWPAVGTYGGANFNHHLSLPDSGWLRLLVEIFWGLDSHQSTTGWGPPFLPAQIGSMFWTLFGRRWGNGWFECVLGKHPLTHIRGDGGKERKRERREVSAIEAMERSGEVHFIGGPE